MTKNQFNEREQLEMLTIDQLISEDHLVRKLESMQAMLTFAAMNLKKLATWRWQAA
ncbi:hypothetical protein [Lysinibacillus cavernae]|uniref:hypothetical protein n=1 Tax=Lysinibacillus cavernae TaxID=2666135 RepID=UPI0018C206D9|nr:hypothetical protein [Lysinibacillus cavernae]